MSCFEATKKRKKKKEYGERKNSGISFSHIIFLGNEFIAFLSK